MNIVKISNKYYKYESVWENKNSDAKDINGNKFPYPKKDKWYDKDLFLTKLDKIEEYLRDINKFTKYKKTKNCLLCDEKNITKGLYEFSNIKWEDGLYHYIEKHSVRISEEFKDLVYIYKKPLITKNKEIARFSATAIQSKTLYYLKLDRNQILIMDALMMHGSYSKKYLDRTKNSYRYSEHAGLLDFSNNGLDKILISGNTNRTDKGDEEIFLPRNMIEAYDYEYIFHTHPATPKPGGRVSQGVLYEFPSISDIFHFIEHYNNGVTQGSIVIAPEGMYNIRHQDLDGKKLKMDEHDFYDKVRRNFYKIQKDAIEKYGEKFSPYFFYSKIAQDKGYITRLNNVLNKFKVHIDYYPRMKYDRGRWYVDTIRLPIYPVEIETAIK